MNHTFGCGRAILTLHRAHAFRTPAARALTSERERIGGTHRWRGVWEAGGGETVGVVRGGGTCRLHPGRHCCKVAAPLGCPGVFTTAQARGGPRAPTRWEGAFWTLPPPGPSVVYIPPKLCSV